MGQFLLLFRFSFFFLSFLPALFLGEIRSAFFQFV